MAIPLANRASPLQDGGLGMQPPEAVNAFRSILDMVAEPANYQHEILSETMNACDSS